MNGPLAFCRFFFFRNKRFIIFFSFSGQSFSLDGLETGGMEQDIVNYDNIDIANLLGLQNAQSLDDIMPMAGTNSPFPNWKCYEMNQKKKTPVSVDLRVKRISAT